MADLIQLRRDTAANWTAANPVLAFGEAGLETDTRNFKVGDGTTAWNSLQYWITTQLGADLITDADGDTTIKVESTADDDTIRLSVGDSPSGYGALTDALLLNSGELTVNLGTADAGTKGADITLTAGTGGDGGNGGDINLYTGNQGSGSDTGGNLNLYLGSTNDELETELRIYKPGDSVNYFSLGFDPGTGAPVIDRNNVSGAIVMLPQAPNPQLIFGSNAAGTASLYLDVKNSAPIRLNNLNPGAIIIGSGGLLPNVAGTDIGSGGSPWQTVYATTFSGTTVTLTGNVSCVDVIASGTVDGVDVGSPKNSIEIDTNQYQLVGDAASPGNSQIYGTNASGTKGWYAQAVTIQQIGGNDHPVYVDTTKGSKTLTVATHALTWSEANLVNNDWCQIGTASNALTGHNMLYQGTIVGATFHCEDDNGNTKPIELWINGALNSNIFTTTTSGENNQENTALNIDFSAGDKLRIRGGTGGTIDDVVVTLFVKWRV